jgi:hypothetical protein
MRDVDPLRLARLRSSYYSPSSPLQFAVPQRHDPEASSCGQLLCEKLLDPELLHFDCAQLRV